LVCSLDDLFSFWMDVHSALHLRSGPPPSAASVWSPRRFFPEKNPNYFRCVVLGVDEHELRRTAEEEMRRLRDSQRFGAKRDVDHLTGPGLTVEGHMRPSSKARGVHHDAMTQSHIAFAEGTCVPRSAPVGRDSARKHTEIYSRQSESRVLPLSSSRPSLEFLTQPKLHLQRRVIHVVPGEGQSAQALMYNAPGAVAVPQEHCSVRHFPLRSKNDESMGDALAYQLHERAVEDRGTKPRSRTPLVGGARAASAAAKQRMLAGCGTLW
jgi:hypothetical protein